MARTYSTMVALGTIAPPFELPDVVSGHAVGRDDVFASSWLDEASIKGNLADDAGRNRSGCHGLLVMFVCVHCPYVKHVEEELARIGKDYEGRIGIAAVSSNDIVAYPQDGPDQMRAQAERLGWRFPYLFDESQEVARSYGAACTPDFFLYDRNLRLVYRGQLDSSRPPREQEVDPRPVDGSDLRAAIERMIAGDAPLADQRTSLGCNIKWRE